MWTRSDDWKENNIDMESKRETIEKQGLINVYWVNHYKHKVAKNPNHFPLVVLRVTCMVIG